MASAWGKSWGRSFGAAWGALGGAVVSTPAAALGGSTIRRTGGKRRVLPYIPLELEEIEQPSAIQTVASATQPVTGALNPKRSKAMRELEHLLFLH